MKVFATATNGQEAVDLWKAHRADVALLDLRMPKLNGVAVIREIRDEDVSSRIIAHNLRHGRGDLPGSSGRGTSVPLKDAPLGELLDCIRKVHCGETCIPPGLAAISRAHQR